MVTEKGMYGLLPIVQKCYFFAGQNLKLIIDVQNDSVEKNILTQKFLKALEFAESIAAKVKSDPLKYNLTQKYLSDFTEAE